MCGCAYTAHKMRIQKRGREREREQERCYQLHAHVRFNLKVFNLERLFNPIALHSSFSLSLFSFENPTTEWKKMKQAREKRIQK